MNSRFAHLLAGAVGGLAATLPMSAVMLLWHRKQLRSWIDPLPPRQITSEVLEVAGLDVDTRLESERPLTVLNHFGYGTTTGAMYGVMANRIRPSHPVLTGALFGLGVWGG